MPVIMPNVLPDAPKQTKFKMEGQQRDSFWFHQNSAAVNIAYAKNVCDVAILPIGAIEQHGAHCPAGSDSYNAMTIAEAVAKKCKAMLLPCPMYGAHPNHHWGMPGTIPLTYETHIGMLVDIIRGAAVAGFNKFIILSAHGQVMSTCAAVHKLGIEGYYTMTSNWYDLLRDNKDILETAMWHADEAETSVALAGYSKWVNLDLAVDDGVTQTIDGKWKMAPGMEALPGMMYHFEGTFGLPEAYDMDTGVIGKPSLASVEKGVKLVDRVSTMYADLVDELMHKYPCGVNPLGFRNPYGYAGAGQPLNYDETHDENGRYKGMKNW